MNTPAIHQALRLQKQPEEMAWLCFPDSDFPDGMSDLLRITASPEQLTEFADKNDIDSEELATALFNFIEKVMLNEKNSDEKTLGTNKLSSPQTQKFHYHLLMKIYHPELSTRPSAEHYSSMIINSYQRLKTKEHEQDIISFSQNRKPPASYYQANKTADTQISNAKTAVAVISAIAICTLVAMTGKFYGNSNIQLSSKVTDTDIKNIVEESNLSTKQVSLLSKPNSNPEVERVKPTIKASKTALQSLLKDLENAYEDGNVDKIIPILANAPELKNQTKKQLNDKLETIFEITSDRKMVLFDFNWKSTNGSLQGEGKFISRYQLVGEKTWLTREGTARVSAEELNNKLKVTQLVLENQNID